MTDIALSLFRSVPSLPARRRTRSAAPVRIKGVWSYRLLQWAFRNS